jgi:hypothetical protein
LQIQTNKKDRLNTIIVRKKPDEDQDEHQDEHQDEDKS